MYVVYILINVGSADLKNAEVDNFTLTCEKVLYCVVLYICDRICEKGSYSLSDCMYLETHNFYCD